MCTRQEIQQLKRRYDLRAEGAYVRDLCERTNEEDFRVLESASQLLKGVDRLHFRQGFLYRGYERNV